MGNGDYWPLGVMACTGEFTFIAATGTYSELKSCLSGNGYPSKFYQAGKYYVQGDFLAREVEEYEPKVYLGQPQLPPIGGTFTILCLDDVSVLLRPTGEIGTSSLTRAGANNAQICTPGVGGFGDDGKDPGPLEVVDGLGGAVNLSIYSNVILIYGIYSVLSTLWLLL